MVNVADTAVDGNERQIQLDGIRYSYVKLLVFFVFVL